MIHIWTTDDFYEAASLLSRWQFYACRHNRRDVGDQYGAAWSVVMDLWSASLEGAANLSMEVEDQIKQAMAEARRPLRQLAEAASMAAP